MNKRNIFIAGLLALVLIVVGCNNSTPGVATVNVEGTIMSASTRDASGLELGAKVIVNNEEVPLSKFKNYKKGTNITITAEVPVDTSTVTLEVSPKAGFIFDEWKFDKLSARRAGLSFREIARLHRELDKVEENERIEVETRYSSYYKATFDRGYYVDLSRTGKAGNGSKVEPFSQESLVEKINSNFPYWDDDFEEELSIKVKGKTEVLDLSGLKALEELKISGYEDGVEIGKLNFNYSRDELELELKNLHIKTLDYSIFRFEDDDDLELENVTIGELQNADRKVVANLIVDKVNTSNSTFVNTVTTYKEGNKYYHSIVKTDGTLPKSNFGKNNIVLGVNDKSGVFEGNLYLDSSEYESGWMLKNPDSIKDLRTAKALNEDSVPFDDDYLEEDAVGRDRPEDDDRMDVSYGPYEYNDWDD